MFLINLFQKSRRNPSIIPENNSCGICFSELNKEIEVQPLSCKHKFCKDCLSIYLKTKIDNNEVLKIDCPQVKCKQSYSQKNIAELVDQETYRLYQEKYLRKLMNRDPNFKFCPQAGCSRQLRPSTTLPYTKCKCNTLVCNTCCQPWHEGKTCLEAIDIEYEFYAKTNSIRFCIMCKSQVDRVYGCNHITCPVCDYDFCWVCGREDHGRKMTKCPGNWSPLPPNHALFNKENLLMLIVPLFAIGGFLVVIDIILSLMEYFAWYLVLPILSVSLFFSVSIISIPTLVVFVLKVMSMVMDAIGFDTVCLVILGVTFVIMLLRILWDYHMQNKRWMKDASLFKYTSKFKPDPYKIPVVRA